MPVIFKGVPGTRQTMIDMGTGHNPCVPFMLYSSNTYYFSVAMKKYNEKTKLYGERFVLVYNSRLQSFIVGK